MKKLVLAIAMIVLAFNANAQEIKFGGKAGLNIANFGGDDADGTGSKVGFHVGAYAHIGISDKFAIQPELLYSTQGASFETDPGDPDVDFNNNYLNVPILAKFYLIEGLNIQAGPQFSLLLSSEFSTQGVDVDVKEAMNTVDFSGVFGLGYELEKINFGARYIFGLTDVIDNPEFFTGNSNDPTPDIKNSVIQIYVGYSF